MDSSSQPGRDSSPTDPSPTDSRRPSQSNTTARDDDRAFDSMQSTDTVRRRPEGKCRALSFCFWPGLLCYTPRPLELC